MNPETMNHPDLLNYGQPELIRGNKETIVLHCEGCGKFKNKKSLSTYCTFCLFGMSDEEAVKQGLILT